jgi:hypothetical protein
LLIHGAPQAAPFNSHPNICFTNVPDSGHATTGV